MSDALDKNIKEVLKTISSLNHKKKPGVQCPGIIDVSTSGILVIAGLLVGALDVISLTIDRGQAITIVLSGSLKKEEPTELEEVMSRIGNLPFDQVIKALLGSLR